MHPQLEKLFLDLEQSKQTLLDLTKNYTEQQQTYKPGVDEWSMVQVLKHLVITETQILQYIQRRMAKEGLQKADYKSWVRYMLVKLTLRYRKKIKAPKLLAAPPSELEPRQVKQEWNQIRQQWASALEHMPDQLIHMNIFRHPAAGDMRISHTLRFMNEHIKHHMAQIRRIRHSANWKE